MASALINIKTASHNRTQEQRQNVRLPAAVWVVISGPSGEHAILITVDEKGRPSVDGPKVRAPEPRTVEDAFGVQAVTVEDDE